MQPLSPRIRVAYLLFFVLLFATLLPLVIFYADGWRFSRTLGFYKTGGVYVAAPYGNVTLSLNGETIGTTGFLQRNFYIDNLAPSTYVLRARAEGYYPWERMVVVEPQVVTDVRVLLMPTVFEANRLVLSGSATGTSIISLELLNEYRSMFVVVPPASSTIPVDTHENVALFIRDGDLFARWLDPESPAPSSFCNRPSYCISEIALEQGNDETLSAQFFEGGVLYRTKEGGVFFSEADVRPTPRSMSVYPKAEADFRVVNGRLVVKDGAAFYEISL